MKIALSWLKQYIHLDHSPEKISELLTGCGLEVEGVETFQLVKGGLEGVVVGEVIHCEKHPNSDHLSLTLVNIGKEEPLKIVCGASNVAIGQKVAVATIGTTLYFKEKEITLQKTKIRGEVSEGMICAEDELGLGSSHEGIMILDPEAKVGMPASSYFNILEDVVFSIGLTPNRADATSHIGVARDLVAVLNNFGCSEPQPGNRKSLILPDISEFKRDTQARKISIQVEDTASCPRYSGLTLTGVTVKESPSWLKNKLLSVGLRPINNIVDVTNYVLMETGQPLHAFDADKITGDKVIVKKCQKGTKFTTLDGIERELTGNDLMICNIQEPMCIAGVFGGTKSGVVFETKNIFLESAYFFPTGIRRTARHHGLQTDASFRFERGTDPEITLFALQRAALLIREIAGGVISSDMVDVYPQPVIQKKVELFFNHLDNLIGKKLEPKVVVDILHDLGMKVKLDHDSSTDICYPCPAGWQAPSSIWVSIPPYKTDVTREADLIEEILRIYGYNNIEISSEIKSSISYSRKPDPDKIQNLVSEYLVGNGFMEIMNNSLNPSSYYAGNEWFSLNLCVNILNPISRDLDVLRQTLLFGGLETILYNQNRKAENLRLFEFGNVYRKAISGDKDNSLPAYHEEKHLALFLTGLSNAESWNTKPENIDFFLLKGYIQAILAKLGIVMESLVIDDFRSSMIPEGLCFLSGEEKLVICGFLSESVLKLFDRRQPVLYAEFNWDRVLGQIPKKMLRFRELPKFPEVRRDLALLVDQSVSFNQIKQTVFEAEKKVLKKVGLFDVYEGEKIDAGKKSYAIHLMLQDESKTLTDKEIEKVIQKIIQVLTEKLKVQIR